MLPYPGIFLWWNPIFRFPLSGEVEQALTIAKDTLTTIDQVLTHDQPRVLVATDHPALRDKLIKLRTQLEMLDRLSK